MKQITDMALIAPLFAGWEENLVRSTLDGCMGRAWANDELTAVKIINGDFSCLAGDPDASGSDELIRLLPDDFDSPWLLTCSMNDSWNDAIERTLSEQATKIERYAIRKEPDVFDRARLQSFCDTLPAEYTLRPIDAELYAAAQLNEWSRDFVSQFVDVSDYLRRGLGVAAMYQGEMIAGASSYVVFDSGIEIEIHTKEEHRRKGVALACAARLILTCLERGLYPSWDASNMHSVALAEKLGYHFDRPYATYSYHTGRERRPIA